ncbi:hypothetical protein FIU89_11270 [Roseovarius sp. THAF27]|uniref:hypothetical protein n=1 Tax=Roseovarius sp. THAF27 TaxID=2587850 RepID=UPI001267DA06|nr:hypothetical protein [Roseovarius sp. THAF27]QFT81190.1 hypothetical protein FIU89_11270 [Roseovarius sp. THAF27]
MPVRTPFRDLPLPQQAGMMACEEHFRTFVGNRIFRDNHGPVQEGAAAEYIRGWCGVRSRRDLATDPRAAERFETLRTEYDAWRGRIPRPNRR